VNGLELIRKIIFQPLLETRRIAAAMNDGRAGVFVLEQREEQVFDAYELVAAPLGLGKGET
jgi:hypothetical protein